MRRVLHFIRPYLIFVITGLLCAVVSVVTQLLVPIFCGDAIDAMIGAGRVDFASVVRIVLAIAVATGITAAAAGLEFKRRVLAQKLLQKRLCSCLPPGNLRAPAQRMAQVLNKLELLVRFSILPHTR